MICLTLTIFENKYALLQEYDMTSGWYCSYKQYIRDNALPGHELMWLSVDHVGFIPVISTRYTCISYSSISNVNLVNVKSKELAWTRELLNKRPAGDEQRAMQQFADIATWSESNALR